MEGREKQDDSGSRGRGLEERKKRRDLIEVFGKTGYGKSYFIKNLLLKEYNRVIIIDPMDEYTAQEFDDLGDMVDHITSHKIFRCKTINTSEFESLCLVCMEVGNITLVIEEAQRVLPSRSQMPEAFEDVIFRGRHRAVNVVLVAQRASSVNINVRSQYSRIVTFNQSERADVQWLEDVSGYDLPDLKDLSIGEYYDITPKKCEKLELTQLKKLVKNT